jgi:hypothetical protein
MEGSDRADDALEQRTSAMKASVSLEAKTLRLLLAACAIGWVIATAQGQQELPLAPSLQTLIGRTYAGRYASPENYQHGIQLRIESISNSAVRGRFLYFNPRCRGNYVITGTIANDTLDLVADGDRVCDYKWTIHLKFAEQGASLSGTIERSGVSQAVTLR